MKQLAYQHIKVNLEALDQFIESVLEKARLFPEAITGQGHILISLNCAKL